jgi:hypothetical protein
MDRTVLHVQGILVPGHCVKLDRTPTETPAAICLYLLLINLNLGGDTSLRTNICYINILSKKIDFTIYTRARVRAMARNNMYNELALVGEEAPALLAEIQ